MDLFLLNRSKFIAGDLVQDKNTIVKNKHRYYAENISKVSSRNVDRPRTVGNLNKKRVIEVNVSERESNFDDEMSLISDDQVRQY